MYFGVDSPSFAIKKNCVYLKSSLSRQAGLFLDIIPPPPCTQASRLKVHVDVHVFTCTCISSAMSLMTYRYMYDALTYNEAIY